MSDSGSSTTSGHWSGSSGVSTPSPPHPQASPKYLGDAFGSPQTDNGFGGMPSALPRLIMDLRPTQTLSCWMNQLPEKER